MRLITDVKPVSKSEQAFAMMLDEILEYRENLAHKRHLLNQSWHAPERKQEVEKKYNEVMELLKILVDYNKKIDPEWPQPALENDRIVGEGHFSTEAIKLLLRYPETPEQEKDFDENLNRFMDAFLNGRKNSEEELIPDSGMKVLETRRGHSAFVSKILDAINFLTGNLLAKITGKDFKDKILSINEERNAHEGPESPKL